MGHFYKTANGHGLFENSYVALHSWINYGNNCQYNRLQPILIVETNTAILYKCTNMSLNESYLQSYISYVYSNGIQQFIQ